MEQLTLKYLVQNKTGLLSDLKRRQAIVRDYVTGVCNHYHTGLYLYGRPGTAKTYTVQQTLERENEPYIYMRGHVTAMGLFELLSANPHGIIVLDDVSSLFRSEVALQILLGALESPITPDRSRIVKYSRQGRTERVCFRGAIICISNRLLHDDEVLNAFKSRVPTLNYDPSDGQLGALVLGLAQLGWPFENPTLDAAQCEEVAHFLIEEMLRLSCSFDLRLFVTKALPLYQQWHDDRTESHWRDLVTAAIDEHLVEVRHGHLAPTSREDRKETEHGIVRQILQSHHRRDEQINAWEKETGKSSRAFYRRLAEIDNH